MASPQPVGSHTATDHPESATSETVLLRRLRDGDDAAFGELYEQHVTAVRGLARGLSVDNAEADDITAETFFRVLRALRRNAGPRDSVRAYLLTVARRVCWEWQAARREVPTPDEELAGRLGSVADSSTTERTVIADAFARLPERWRAVLWQTEVEGERPAVIARHLGLSANAAAALARRARNGLRAAYLQEHVAVTQGSWRCRRIRDKLGGYTAGMVTGKQARRVRAHLRWCPTCRAEQRQLRDVCSTLRSHAAVVALLVPAGGLALAGVGASTGGSAAGVAMATAGTKLKIGLVATATTAAGTVAVTPVTIDWHAPQTIGMPPHSVQLTVATSPATSRATTSPLGSSPNHTARGAVTVASPEAARAEPPPVRHHGVRTSTTAPAPTVPVQVQEDAGRGNDAESSVREPTATSTRDNATGTPRLDLSSTTGTGSRTGTSSRTIPSTTSGTDSSRSSTSPPVATSEPPGSSTGGSSDSSSDGMTSTRAGEPTTSSAGGSPSTAGQSSTGPGESTTASTTGREAPEQ